MIRPFRTIRPSRLRTGSRLSAYASPHARPALAILFLLAQAFTPRLIPAQQQPTKASSMESYIQQQIAASQDTIFHGHGDATAGDREDPIMRERRIKAMNAQRQKAIVEDTDKLLRLTAELDAEVSSNHPQSLNSDQLRRVAEIEKLAKSVREKMTDAIGPPPRVMGPINLIGGGAPYAY